MEKIIEKEYKGYRCIFFITPKTWNYLIENNIYKEDIIWTDWHLFESELFEILDEDGDGIPDEKFGKNFKIVYYGITDRKNIVGNSSQEDLEILEDFSYDEKKVLAEGSIRFENKNKEPFLLEYKILFV